LNPYLFNISLYDLAFLGAIITGLNFILLLWFTKKANRCANRFLALALATAVLWMARLLGIDIGLSAYVLHWSWLPLQFSLALGPFIFFYVLKITRPDYKFRTKDLLHFSPLLLELGNHVVAIRESLKTGIAPYETPSYHLLNPVLQFLAFISVSIYLYMSYRLIERFYQRMKFNGGDRYRFEFRWLHNLLTGLSLLWLLWIPFTAVDYFGYHYRLGIHAYYPLYLLLAIMIIRMAATAHLKAEAGVPTETPSYLKPLLPVELKQKGIWLKKTMQASRYYQDPELSLSSLAEKLDLSPHELSRIINTALKKSFTDFINEYRVAEVIKKMQEPANDNITLLGIANNSGFNSKSTFNRIFKEMTGKSPAEYKSNLKKEFPIYNPGLYPGHHPRLAAVISNHGSTLKWPDDKSNRNFMFKNYFKIAWRNLIKDRQFSLLNLIGLSSGLACVLLIYLWVTDELSIDKFNKNDSRLYQVLKKNTDGTGAIRIGENTQGLLAEFIAKELPEVEFAACTKKQREPGVLSFGDKKIKATIRFVSNDFFKVFSYELIRGNKRKPIPDVTSVLLSDQTALKFFNSTDVVGKSVEWHFNDDVDFSGVYKIAGVFKASPVNATDHFDVLFPFELYAKKNAGGFGDVTFWGSNMVSTYVLLKPGTNAAVFNRKIKDFSKAKIQSLYKDGDFAKYEGELFIQKYSDRYLYNNFVNGVQSGGRIEYVKLFSIIAFFILVIACINFMNLSTAKASRRMKEVGIKKVVGASRRSLILQYLGESMLISFAALIIALLVAALMLPAFREITGKEINLHFTPAITLSAIIITFITGLAAGSYPALYLSGFKPVSILKGKLNTSAGESWIRKGLVVFQFSISVILIVSVLVIYQQMKLIHTTNLGYNKDNIIRLNNDGNLQKNLSSFIADLKNLPGVVNASDVDGDLIGNYSHAGGGISWEGKDPNLNIEYYGDAADIDYFETVGLQMAEGRAFSKNFNDSSSVIFNQSAIAAMGLKDPVGKTVSLWGIKKQIIGIVKDFHFESFYKKIGPAFFTFSNKNPVTVAKIKAGTAQQTIAGIKNLYHKYNAGLDFNYAFLDDDYNKLYASEQRVSLLSRYFAGIAILISCLGLFGLAAFTAQKRQKEIGIRKVIGASVSNIVAMLSKDFLVLVCLALLIAIPLSWWAANEWLQSFAYRINIGPLVFIITGASVLLITLLTISFQSIKAAIANPVKSLRTE